MNCAKKIDRGRKRKTKANHCPLADRSSYGDCFQLSITSLSNLLKVLHHWPTMFVSYSIFSVFRHSNCLRYISRNSLNYSSSLTHLDTFPLAVPLIGDTRLLESTVVQHLIKCPRLKPPFHFSLSLFLPHPPITGHHREAPRPDGGTKKTPCDKRVDYLSYVSSRVR